MGGFEDAIVQIKFTDINLVLNIGRDVGSYHLSGPFQKWNELSVCRTVDPPFINSEQSNEVRISQGIIDRSPADHLICENGDPFNISSSDVSTIQELDRVLSNQMRKMPICHNF